MDKFKNKYRIASARARWWDYGWNGAYFITICTLNREWFFGFIEHNQLIESEPGKVVATIWHDIPQQFPYAELGDFVVMPNHIHGILILNKPTEGGMGSRMPIQTQLPIQTRLIASLPPTPTPPKTGGFCGEHNPMLRDNVARIIRWYKGRCSFEIRKFQSDFAWQARFHDHIIKNDGEYQRISDYIIHNPAKWQDDKFYIVDP